MKRELVCAGIVESRWKFEVKNGLHRSPGWVSSLRDPEPRPSRDLTDVKDLILIGDWAGQTAWG